MKAMGQNSRIACLSSLLLFALLGGLLSAGPALAQKDEGIELGPDLQPLDQTQAAEKPDGIVHLEPAPPFPLSRFESHEISDHANSIVDRGGIQSDLPADRAPPELPNWNLEWLVPILKIIGWIVVAAFVVGLAVLAYVMFSGVRFNAKILGKDNNGEAARHQRPQEDQPMWSRDALGSADRLAAEGNFSEAAHVLLLGSLGELKARFIANLPSSLTSREIIARIPMPEGAKNALSILILSVEISLFGDQGLIQSDYDSCRDAYLRFAEPGA